MPWLILVLGALFGIVWLFSEKTSKTKGYDSDGITGLMIVLGMFILVAFVGWPIAQARTTASVAELEAFQESVFETYVSTIDATDKAVVKLDLEKLLVSAENLKQSTNLSDRIAELRNKVVWYNESLKKLRALNNIWWLDAYVKDVPGDLKPVKLSVEHFNVLKK